MTFYQHIRNSPKAFIIAEAGVNHNGRLALAKKLVDAAQKAGCDAVKFQTFRVEEVISRSAPKAAYQKKTTDQRESQFDMAKKLELSGQDHRELFRYCRKQRIIFLSTPFDHPSADLLEELGVRAFKIPSGEVTNFPFLRHVARKGKPIILSTGMSTLAEVREALRVIYSTGNRQVVLLHCVTAYPAPAEAANLRAMITLRDTFKVPVGFSDHTLGYEASLAAVVLGAKVIEKHLTLDKKMPGPDHRASLNPSEFREMVAVIRRVEAALGDGRKRPATCELKIRDVARRSIVACREIPEGTRISAADLAVKRPGTGIPPKKLAQVIGCRTRVVVRRDELIGWNQLTR